MQINWRSVLFVLIILVLGSSSAAVRPIRHSGIIDGNQIRTLIFDFGSIGAPGREPSFEWPQESAHGYAYEFGLLVAGEVIDIYGDTIHIVSDGLIDGGAAGDSEELSPEGLPWGWEPLEGYANSDTDLIALSDDQETWPEEWSEWPGAFGEGVVVADLESYWVMNDRFNEEFEYYPDPGDPTIGGLGIQVECRSYQWNETTDNDLLILTYNITNVSEKSLPKLVAGFMGDPHVGGSNDYADDWAGFLNNNGIDTYTGDTLDVWSLAYVWDDDNVGQWGNDVGYFGLKCLESPLSDGYLSFHAPMYGSIMVKDDEEIWDLLVPGNISDISQDSDNIMLVGTGYFSLEPGETKILTVAVVFGEDKDDFLWNANTAQIKYSLFNQVEPHEVFIINPDSDEYISGSYQIEWESVSSTGNPLDMFLYYNLNRGEGWNIVSQFEPDDGTYLWDSSLYPDGYTLWK